MLLAEGLETLLEAPAGILDTDDPAGCARREAMEEAGLALEGLVAVGTGAIRCRACRRSACISFWPSTARRAASAKAEGSSTEHEEIEVVEVGLAELAAMADGGGLHDLKTLVLLQALRLRRPDLFGQSKSAWVES